MKLDFPFEHGAGAGMEPSTRTVFSRLAPHYERIALLERASGERLLDMLAIGPKDFVLDLGCGPGHLTRRIRTRTNGKLYGVDAAAGMVAQARWNARGLGITFQVKVAENLDFDRNFNVVFCNSALQWFASPGRAVDGCYRALRRGGWLGMQAPATRHWCSLARDVIAAAAVDPRTREVFTRFRDPMFFLSTVEEYTSLFTASGFDVHDAWIEVETTRHTIEEALAVLEAMVGAALFNAACYVDGADDSFFEALHAVARDTVVGNVGSDGLVELTVQRLYLLAVKPLIA